MKPLNPTDGFTLHGFMVTDLHLKGAELVTFALVHQFTQGFAGIYKGNTQYLSAWTGWTEKTCRGHLAALVEKGLIVEMRGRENNSPYCYYKLAPDFYEKHPVNFTVSPGKNFQKHPVNSSQTTRKKLPGEYKNIDNNKENKFIPPTPLEITTYCADRGWRDPEGFAKHFLDYYNQSAWHLSNGKPMKDWKKAVITWEPNNKFRNFHENPSQRGNAAAKGDSVSRMLALGQQMGFIQKTDDNTISLPYND